MVKPQATEEEMIAALKAACAWEFVEKLEEGIHTQVREQGQRFSEGQKQRLSIARALLADAPVMILDEATSALDCGNRTPGAAQHHQKKNPCRTLIVAAHRPSVFPCAAGYIRFRTTGSWKWMNRESVNFWKLSERKACDRRNPWGKPARTIPRVSGAEKNKEKR